MKTVFLGDSHFHGAGTSNASVFGIPAMVSKIVGSLQIQRTGQNKFVTVAVPGGNVATLSKSVAELTRVPPKIAVIMLGTNPSPTYSEFINLMETTVSAFALVGAKVFVGLVPPRNISQSQESHERGCLYNLGLVSMSKRLGFTLVDTITPVCGPDGLLSNICDSGDGVHFNDYGATQIAKAFASAIVGQNNSVGFVRQSTFGGLSPNVAQNDMTGWGNAGGVGSAGSSTSVVQDPWGLLPFGNWFRLEVDNTTSNEPVYYNTRYLELTPKPNEGDLLAIGFHVCQDGGSLEGAGVKVALANGYTDFSILTTSFGARKPGEYLDFLTVPAGVTSLRLRLTVSAKPGEVNRGYLGAFQVWNLTEKGIGETFLP